MSDVKRLTRSSTDKKIAGVCGGIAAYFDGVDSTLIRVIAVILAVFAFGFGGLIVYIVLAIIIPLDTDVDNMPKKDDRW
ncbi:MAG: PspC domain-containing protein [Paludibacteraceae bacterium]|nr:PspC domain-containing protein [Paludibacteraceae bacterium]MBR6190922.1 PspC domain-containing protein [Prevotella sp.]MBQ6962971.1 PspC domain-containing protein [Paludibacteraceae bacterium]MBQ7748683.1 PspC domain-containing protein [Paludibacteraceae bacterium]MBR0499267.1 PspC domain-containing protein [Paludibacteraceae bacterium]